MLPEIRKQRFNAEESAFELQMNFIYELGTRYPNNGKEFSDFLDCLVFLKVLLNILTKSGEFFLLDMHSFNVWICCCGFFWWNSSWCGMFWLNKDFIMSSWSIKKHCHSVQGDVWKIQYCIACQISACICVLLLKQPTKKNLHRQRKSDQICKDTTCCTCRIWILLLSS